MALLLCLPTLVRAVSPYEAVQRGNTLYQQGQYHEAEQQYAEAAQQLPEAKEIPFNQGNVFYKQQDYGKALEHYERALQTPDPMLESRTKYNLGNVKYQQALHALSNPQEAATHLQAAMTYYRDSLEREPQQQDARYNLELAQRLLRQLQQQQAQQQQQNQQESQQQQEQQAQQKQQTQQQQQASQDPQQQAQQKQQQNQQQDGTQQPQDQRAGQSPQGDAAPDTAGTQQRQAEVPQMTPEEAERLLEAIRERAREADNQRQQWRRARMHDTRVDKDW
jgi:tetratricopeptide (TPR) repeat protein